MSTPNSGAAPLASPQQPPSGAATLADIIAEHLADGLHYTSTDGQRKTLVLNPSFRPRGYPPHIADVIRANNQAIAKAILELIATNGYTITPKNQGTQ